MLGRCPVRLRDMLKSRPKSPRRQEDKPGKNPFRTPDRSNTNPFRMGASAPASKKTPGQSQAARRQVRFSAEANQTFPYVSDGYHRGRVAAIDEAEEDHDPQDEMDFTTLDDQTIAALYEGLVDEPSEEEAPEEEDFPEGS